MSLTSENDSLFLVCDGVGGSAMGNCASELACRKISEYVNTNSKQTINDAFFYAALEFVYQAFCEYELSYPQSKGMATTLTLFYKSEHCIWTVHLGDSRIYHIRDGAIVHKTQDHSFVGNLLSAGIITEEEARRHPKKNIITKAIQAGDDQKCQPEIFCTNEIYARDYFFLCTDGVIESVADEQLCAILGNVELSNQDKMHEIFLLCAANSKDNFSAYLIQIDKGVEKESIVTIDTVPDIDTLYPIINAEASEE